MKLSELTRKLSLTVKAGSEKTDPDVTTCYCGDILSDVMSHAKEGSLWITMHTHNNIVTVAMLQSLAGVILVNNRHPEEDTMRKANDEDVLLLTTNLTAFEIAGRLYELGVRG